MRVAFSGSHRVGKSTLLERVADALPGYATVEEPYTLLESEGHEGAEDPAIEDFEAQLERSIAALLDGEGDVLFDRCPADIIAYLLAHEDAAAFDLGDWIDRARAAMRTLDLVVFVPVEAPDRIALAPGEDRDHRRAVHDELDAILVDDALGFDAEVLVVAGSLAARVEQVLSRIVRAG